MVASGLAMFVLGNGSNLLVADGEHDVLGVHLVGEFEELRTRDEGDVVVVDAGAGLDLPIAARRLAKSGVAGFEWAVGVPGSFGGAAVMNAGGHGSDMNESLVSVTVWHDGATRTWSKELLDFGYRTSALASRRPGDVGAAAPSRRGQRDVPGADPRDRALAARTPARRRERRQRLSQPRGRLRRATHRGGRLQGDAPRHRGRVGEARQLHHRRRRRDGPTTSTNCSRRCARWCRSPPASNS